LPAWTSEGSSTKPVVTASQATMTIGTVRVAFLAATIASSPIAMMTSTFRIDEFVGEARELPRTSSGKAVF